MNDKIILRISTEEKEKIKVLAKENGMTVSQYVRYKLLYADKEV